MGLDSHPARCAGMYQKLLLALYLYIAEPTDMQEEVNMQGSSFVKIQPFPLADKVLKSCFGIIWHPTVMRP